VASRVVGPGQKVRIRKDFPQSALPEQLKDNNSLKMWRMINGEMTKE
jgi:hypothetical protein